MSNVSKLVAVTLPFEVMLKFDKEKNKSGLIRDLLLKHYDISKLIELPRETLDKLKQMALQKDKLEKEMEKMANGL